MATQIRQMSMRSLLWHCTSEFMSKCPTELDRGGSGFSTRFVTDSLTVTYVHVQPAKSVHQASASLCSRWHAAQTSNNMGVISAIFFGRSSAQQGHGVVLTPWQYRETLYTMRNEQLRVVFLGEKNMYHQKKKHLLYLSHLLEVTVNRL